MYVYMCYCALSMADGRWTQADIPDYITSGKCVEEEEFGQKRRWIVKLNCR